MTELPLFPLDSVLFPDGRSRIRVFEKRYMDMVSACLKREQSFGVCLIRDGYEVGEAAQPYSIGTVAHLDECDMPQAGILHISVRGGRRFRVGGTRVLADQLIVSDVEFLPDEPYFGVTAPYEDLRELLAKILTEIGEHYYLPRVKLGDAVWVAYRLAEFLPVSNWCRQQVLEQPDPWKKLDILATQIVPTQTDAS